MTTGSSIGDAMADVGRVIAVERRPLADKRGTIMMEDPGSFHGPAPPGILVPKRARSEVIKTLVWGPSEIVGE